MLLFLDVLSEKPRGMKERNTDEKYSVKSVKLNNNHLQTLPDLFDVLSQVILRPQEITWIDVSFNELTSIDRVRSLWYQCTIDRSLQAFDNTLYCRRFRNIVDDISFRNITADCTTLV